MPGAVCTPLATITADPHRLDQVFDNLLQNAVKYSPHGGQVVVCLREAAGDGAAGDAAARGVRVSVHDQGIGLPPDTGLAIFEPFGRASNAMRYSLPGMGLGLHICRELIRQHGGRIWAESLGEG